MVAFIWMLFIGLIVGAHAKLVMPGKDAAAFSLPCCSGLRARW